MNLKESMKSYRAVELYSSIESALVNVGTLVNVCLFNEEVAERVSHTHCECAHEHVC